MNVAVRVEFKADRKEPLGQLVRRVAAQFERCGLQPEIVATFSDGPAGMGGISAVERAIRKHQHLAAFERTDAPLLGIPPTRRLTSDAPANPFPMDALLALADGVPRSLPFHAVSVHFGHAGFGQIAGFARGLARASGIEIGDSWWVNGRNRHLSAVYAVEGDAASKKLPDPPAAIGAILTCLGKPKRTAQFVPSGAPGARAMLRDPAASAPGALAAISPIVATYRDELTALVQRIGLPYDLPSAAEARAASFLASGPLKPALVAAFTRRGYDCRGGRGTFTLRRRTTANHIIEVELDVGTWSRSVTFMFHVRGPGFNATLLPRVTTHDHALQYPIGDTANWQQIVANIAVVVDELERTFVVEIEAAVGPAPEWFDPGR